MALPAFVRATGLFGGGAAGGIALTSSAMATETGSYLFVGSTHYTTGVNVSAVTDTVGNTFVRAGTVQGGDANQDNEIWYTPNPIVGTLSNAVIVKYTAAASYRDVTQCCFSWGGTTSITYGTEAAHAFPSGSAMASGTLSVAAEGLLIGNWVAYDTPRETASSTGTIMIAVPNSASSDMVTGFRLFTASNAVATLTIVQNTSVPNRYSVIAKAFRGIAGTATAAISPTLALMGVGR